MALAVRVTDAVLDGQSSSACVWSSSELSTRTFETLKDMKRAFSEAKHPLGPSVAGDASGFAVV
jgi:hypothetical protein